MERSNGISYLDRRYTDAIATPRPGPPPTFCAENNKSIRTVSEVVFVFPPPRPADGRETRRVPYRESESRDACVKPQTHPMGVEMGASVQAVSVALRFIRLRLNAHLPYALYAV